MTATMGQMLGQRVDSDQRLVGASAIPVLAQLGLVLASPIRERVEPPQWRTIERLAS
jgi:hypothetical protein